MISIILSIKMKYIPFILGVLCPDITSVKNGALVGSGPFRFGDNASAMCNPGFRLKVAVIQCQASGEWTDQLKCKSRTSV